MHKIQEDSTAVIDDAEDILHSLRYSVARPQSARHGHYVWSCVIKMPDSNGTEQEGHIYATALQSTGEPVALIETQLDSDLLAPRLTVIMSFLCGS